jgi:phosphopantetheine--protein transferase-like protein
LIGIDLLYIPRIRKILDSVDNASFIEKILTAEEIKCFRSIDSDKKAESLAYLFAMKEAVIKASTAKLTIMDLNLISIGFETSGRRVATIKNCYSQYFVSANLLGEYIAAVAVGSY